MDKRKYFVFARQYRNCFSQRINALVPRNQPMKTAIAMVTQDIIDIFSIVHKAYLQELLEHINSLHPQTQFTKEEENISSLPFLDTSVLRNHDKTISVRIYRKPMHTNQNLKYTSHNPTSAKRSVIIIALFDRADNVVSNEKGKIEGKHHILAALQQNGYPKEFIQRTVKKHHRRKEQPRERPEEEPKQTKSINLRHIQGLSEQLKRAFNKRNIKATFYTQTTLRSLLSKPKDHIPKEDRNNAVYRQTVKIAKPSTWEKQNEH